MSSRWQELPCLFVSVLFCVFRLTTSERHAVRREALNFEFTQDVYNATIMENSIGKTYVTPLTKMGIYLSPDMPDVKYAINSGDNSRLFKPEARRVGNFCFLRVRTRSGVQAVINREQEDQYRLTIKATLKLKQSPILTATTELLINVIDMNDLSPLFDHMDYRVDVAENVSLHQSIVKLTASDADIGINGEIYYSLSQVTETFAIHPTSGVVTVTHPLSFSQQPYYQLDVLARDRGPVQGREARVIRTSLQIRILEVNQYSPQIDLHELPAIVEHGKVGTIYAVLHVTDKDYGRNGQINKINITAGDPDGHFRLQKGQKDLEYRIHVARDIDRELYPDGFNLTVVAADKGFPPRNSSIMLHVKLQDTNDHSPQFPSQFLKASVEECSPLHTPIVFVVAFDTDCGKNAELVYSIVSGNSLGLFSINPVTGLVSVAGLLDAETWTSINLTVQAQDLANRGSRKTSTVTLQVDIADCNDNSPVFGAVPVVVYVEENQPVQTSVFHIEAHDADGGENGFISYSLSNVESVPFAIDHFKGDIITKELLDYETMRRTYNLVIRASDWGSPFRRETELILRVRIKDANDNRPQFEKVNCTGYLSKEAQLGTELLVVSAIDFDFGNIVSYHIISGNNDEVFELDSSTGSLKLRRSLKGDRMSFRQLRITASDGTNSADPISIDISLVNRNRKVLNSDASFNCHKTNLTEELNRILRIAEQSNQGGVSSEMSTTGISQFSQNLNSPKFTRNPNHIVVPEGLASGTKVMTLIASDDDQGYNGRLQFAISGGNDRDVFKIHTYTGDLSAIGNLDREVTDRYVLNITVSDMGKTAKHASMLLEVNVTDINDNAPEFNQSIYAVSVPENTNIPSVICAVKAVDRDLGSNGRIGYSLADSMGTFAIDARNGCISIVRSLDRERVSEYALSVVATDRSSERPLSSSAVVHVKVTDINDNAPKFYPAGYDVHVLEDIPVGTVVATLFARDPDVGLGGSIRYSLMDGTDEQFEIDQLTGAIRVRKELNFDKKQVYNVTARAGDRGEPSLFSEARLTILIVDVNNNLHPPVFKDIVFTCHVQENQPPRTSVMQVLAVDNDLENPLASSRDYQIVYSIRNGTGLGLFTIDSKGMIYTRQPLDRETQAHYWLTVYAQDMGSVPLSSMTEIYIEIDDVNDNAPQTSKPVYYVTVQENSSVYTPVLQLVAYDMDDLSSNQLLYDITSGNPQGFFAINHTTGLMTTGNNRLLDREKQEEHILEVTISDSGVPSLSSVTRVVVKVSDLNDEEPRFLDRQHRVRIPQLAAEFLDIGLYRVLAADKDVGANAELLYSIAPNKENKADSKFRIDAKTGMIYAVSVLDKDIQYDLQVKATDNGWPKLSATTRVILTVMDIPSSSADPPKFKTDGVQVRLMESDEVGHLVSLMSASDADGDKVWYFITGGNADDTFSIDTENGNILLARLLDWEVRKFYNMTIEATDGVHWTKTWVYVTVLDVNDNTPQFDQTAYEVNVTENAPVGTDICSVMATDADEDGRLFYTIHSVASSASVSKFRINSETGVITTLQELNREAVAQHELTVMVRDQGALSKRSLTKVIIHVLDLNDHPPEFLEENIKGWIYSSAIVGTQVLQVVAYDADKGSNAEITYTIASGNIGGMFSIDPTMGIILVARSVESIQRSEYVLTIKASDNGSPSLFSTTTVQIEVVASNNSPPKFDLMEYNAEIAENQPMNSFIAVVRATCQSSVMYELVGGKDETYFSINPSSGVLLSNAVFDYEAKSFYNLTVRATSIMGAWAQTIAHIHITDLNDNAPVFVQTDFVGNISESSTPGSYVLDRYNAPLVVRASDADSSRNCLLIYQIVDARAQDIFEIDPSTGAIRTKVILDRELVQLYDFTVQVFDHGEPPRSAAVAAKVRIYIDDVNDSPPVFTERIYRATLLLPTQPDVALVELLAKDADSAPNAVLEYRLVRGNGKENFALDPRNGILTVIDVNEMLDSYELTVKVTDGQFEDTATVQVSVDLRQTSGLQFLSDVYEASITENVMKVRNITIVHAVGQALNEHLTFTLLNSKSLFEIKSMSGVIQTTGLPFDRETRPGYILVVEVRDERVPARIAHCLVNITIIDVNDYVPVFVNQPYFVVVPVDTEIGEVIKRLTAIDHDIGANGIVDFFLVEGDETLFSVHQETGEIVTHRALSVKDSRAQHRLVVGAQDRGDPVLKSQAEVIVTIMDRATPVFDQLFYSVLVPESLPLHSTLITILASSPTGGKLVYSIVKGDEYGEFAVDFNTGTLSTLDHLDYETSKLHELTIRALDIQSGFYGDAVVRITVEDVNDHRPLFEKLRYNASILESVPIGSSVLTVLATDEDSENNAKVWYQIEPHPLYPTHTAYFQIDSTRGTIFVKQRLDHEQIKKLMFVVMASDSGVPQMSSSVSVAINVIDANDNPPKFEQLTYEVAISDQAKRGQFLLAMLASDDDNSDRGRLRYAIVGGNVGQMFVMDSFRGTLSITDLRRTEFQPSYSLNVSVTDGVFTSFTRVRVNVEGSNLHEPQFSQLLYEVDVYEQQDPGQLIVVVNASDEDPGKNGLLTYKIINVELEELFVIDSNSGAILTKSVLLCETSSIYLLRISATDGGGRVGQMTVCVNVHCQGDLYPVFVMNEYKANVYSASHHGSSVVKVTALDTEAASDSIKQGSSVIEYSMVLDNDSATKTIEYFMVDANTGLVTVNSSLIGLENELLQYFVRARKRDVQELYTDVSVEIYVMSSLDRPPLFEKDIYSYFVIESRPIGSVIATITANSNDSLTYRIVPGNRPSANTPPVFTIDNNGVIRIINELDRESVEKFKLNIRAETQASPGLVAHATVVIHIQDVNDNAPKFVTNHFIAGIAENGIAGERVVQIEARDSDLGANGEITYELAAGDQKSPQLFSIDRKTGWITSVSSLDREIAHEHKFEVIAIDHGTSGSLSSSAAVTIHVIDRNDEAPVFAQSYYSGAVNEDALPGTIIFMVTATDRDQDPNNIINFHISEGDPYGQFNIRKTGEIYVNKELDRELKPSYDLVVLATDGTFVSSASVSITILDANDNAPLCEQDDYQKVVPENIGLGSFIIRVSAQDVDEPGTRNSRIDYYIENNETSAFTINRRTGIITLRQLLDRETTPEYYLKVIAQDGGDLSCASDVTILLSDINDNAPVFTQANYVAMVPENFGSKMLVTRVAALDADLDVNKRISYSMDESDRIFTIDPTSGVITLQESLDREEQEAFNLTVYASDQGHPRLSSSAMVTVLLVDVNDNPPEFERSMYSFSIHESVAIGTTVGKVFATSRDAGVNAEITYTVREDSASNFVVKSHTGEIIVVQDLDYEQVREYTLVIEGMDGGSPRLSSTSVVKIDVTDENDNVPSFVRPSYQFSIQEDVAVNTTIVQMEAVDIDSGPNGMIEFHLLDEFSDSRFSINPLTGRLFTTAPLDRETIAVHNLLIMAVDKGEPPKTASVQVRIDLTDVNDCPPRFMNENFTASIQADIGLGSSVFTLEVSDEDMAPNGEPFIYDIIESGQQKFFIDKGVIKTASTFSRSIKDVYVITVRVLDNGSPPLYSDVDVTIYITEESVSPPVVTPLKVTVTAFDDSFPASIIGRMKAVDPDVHDRLTFALLTNDYLFDIDPVDGTLRTVQALDAGEYTVNVSVTDGRFLRYAEARVYVESITSEMTDSAVVIRLEYLTAEEFVMSHLNSFVSVLKAELSVRERDVRVLSMQPASETEVTPGRRKRNAESHLDVLVAVQRSQNKYFKGSALKRRLEQSQSAIEQTSGLKINKVFNSACTKDTCKEGDCQTTYQFENQSPYNVITDSENYVIIPFNLVYRCVCKPGSSGPMCAEKQDVCSPGLCRDPKICNSNGQSYTCSCPEGRAGDDCNDVVEPPCTDALCRKDKPMTLSGSSYIRWRLTVPMERRLSLSLELKTVQANARILHATGGVDYSILEIDDGYIQYRFDCGSGPGLARITRKLVNDGQWHMVVVERTGKSVRIVLDGQFSAEGIAPGTNDVLNLDSNDVFFGAEVELLQPGVEEIRQGFIGCLQKIKIDHVDLPLLGSSSVAVLQHLQDIDFHCRGAYIPGICSSAPCRNGGSCLPLGGGDTYMCKCRSRFLGALCEIDTNPCASDPCLNGGHCEVVLNNFKCACPARAKGRRCELNKFCDPNPCGNGARCSDGVTGPSCECIKGYQGDLCDHDVDECRESPCANGGSCRNVNGGFICNCTAMSSGELCDVLIYSAVSSSPWNIGIEEIIGIVVAVAVLLVTAVVVILLCRCYRHKQRQRRLDQRCKLQDDIFEKQERQELKENGRNVMLMNSLGRGHDQNSTSDVTLPKPSPQPPPLPRRPASYTPSAAESFNMLNALNSDVARNYGSAADELENAGTCKRTETPVFLQNCEAQKSPRTVRLLPQPPIDEDPTLKDLNNLNKAENYRKNPKKLNKTIPSANPSLQSLQLLHCGASISSLPISESESDLQSYHWDMSDMDPGATLYLKSPELAKKIQALGSPSSSRRDQERYTDDFDGNESEYVGDSEFTENELGNEDVDMENDAYHGGLTFKQILAMKDELNYGSDEFPPHCKFNLHPNNYLPEHDVSQGSDMVGEDLPEIGSMNGNYNSADYICRDDDDDVIHYGFPGSTSASKFNRNSYTDTEMTGPNVLDNMSVSVMSVGGCKSANGSVSDLSGLCMIEDSEANNSDEDNDDETRDVKKRLLSKSVSGTQV